MTEPVHPGTRRGTPIEELLARARADLDRVPPERLGAELADGALVVDTRPVEQREAHGEIPGALVIDRNVLEWRLDPTSPDALADVADHDVRVVVVCQQGYSSSLAAQSLRWLGLWRATDLEGGYEAWARWRGSPPGRGIADDRPGTGAP